MFVFFLLILQIEIQCADKNVTSRPARRRREIAKSAAYVTSSSMADVTHDVKEVAREVFFWGILLLSSSPNCHDVQLYNQVPFAKKGYPGSSCVRTFALADLERQSRIGFIGKRRTEGRSGWEEISAAVERRARAAAEDKMGTF